MLNKLVLTGLLAACIASAQGPEWEIGAIGGYGYAPHLTVSNKTGSADTGIRHGAVVGVFAGEDMYNTSAGIAAWVARALASRSAGPIGMRSPSELFRPELALREVAAAAGLTIEPSFG